jgi:hypothetical protein
MESEEECLGWGLRGVEWAPVGGAIFETVVPEFLACLGEVVRVVGTNGETNARRGAKRGP